MCGGASKNSLGSFLKDTYHAQGQISCPVRIKTPPEPVLLINMSHSSAALDTRLKTCLLQKWACSVSQHFQRWERTLSRGSCPCQQSWSIHLLHAHLSSTIFTKHPSRCWDVAQSQPARSLAPMELTVCGDKHTCFQSQVSNQTRTFWAGHTQKKMEQDEKTRKTSF